ncbi:hypothetical protein LCM20_02610 [Halobacillus litoralis]|uniref:hypothetical protein n=1 Tax=Halobacillus litoralis TaxID=45668 RepID=UPI001CD7EB4E|nr:hypothetical protein [Halobacillus litoralis]MCA0969482.1 hypothetical protein [Halobacillus litoralis]
MNAKQRVYGPVYPSHTLTSHTDQQKDQLNHWCDEMDPCVEYHQEPTTSNDKRSRISRTAGVTFIN